MLKSVNRLAPTLRWGLAFPLIYFNGLLLLELIDNTQPLFSILVSAVLLAFLLEFPLNALQGWGLRRSWALGIVLSATIFVLIGLGLTVVPLLIQQLYQLGNLIPQWAGALSERLRTLDALPFSEALDIDWSQLEKEITRKVTAELQAIGGQVLNVALGTFTSVLNTILTLVFTVFLLISGETIWNGLLSWLPPWWADQVRQSLPAKFRAFVGGQVIVALILSGVLSVSFLFLKVPLAVLFGFSIGLASLLPFCGAIAQVLVSFFLFVQNTWLGLKVFAVALILGQINDNFVSPRVMGGLIGLNPVWLLLSVLIGTRLGGFLGLIVAVPLASVIKTIADNWRERQQQRETEPEGDLDPMPTEPADSPPAPQATEESVVKA